MHNNQIKICAKGSRKNGAEFIKETKYLATLVDCIEIDLNYPHDSNFRKELNFLKQLRAKNNIHYTVHAQYFGGSLNDFNKKIREESLKQVYQAIDTAVSLGAKIVTLHPALEPYGLRIADREKIELAIYKKIAGYAAKKQVKIGLENEAQTCFWFPNRACKFKELRETVKQVKNKSFGHTLDIGHANVSGEDYLKAITDINKNIFHVHLHDNLGLPEENIKKYNRPDPHLPPGQGMINWKKVITALRKIHCRGYVELECEIKDMAGAIEYLSQF